MKQKKNGGHVGVPPIAGSNQVGKDRLTRAANIPEGERCPACSGTGLGPSETLTEKNCPVCGGSGLRKSQ